MEPPFEHRPTVRFADVDGLGHVNNAAFLTYLEEARVALFRKLTGQRGLQLLSFLLARAEIDFRRPVEMDDAPIVRLWVTDLGKSSFRFGYEVTVEGTVVAEAETVQVWIDEEEKTSAPIPDEVRKALEGLRLASP